MNTNELVKENNELRDLLTPTNRDFYEDLMVLVRMKSLFRDESVYEDTLLSIVQDLLEAQSAGQSAEEYLGRDIYAIANEIVSETPRMSKLKVLKLVLMVLGIYLLASIVPSTLLDLLLSPAHTATISIAGVLIGSLYTLLLVWLFFKSFSISRWWLRLAHQKFFKSYLQVLPIGLVIFGIYLLISWLTQNIWTITF
jgi:hypothetical protein